MTDDTKIITARDYRNRPSVDEPANDLALFVGFWHALLYVAMFALIILSAYACAVAFGLATRPGWL